METHFGTYQITVRIENLASSGEPYEIKFLVDTAAIDCLAPSNALKKAGIALEGRDVYELANGEVPEYLYFFARVSFMEFKTEPRLLLAPMMPSQSSA